MEKTIESAVRQRVLDFIHYKRITQREFEKRCRMSNGYINQIKKGIGNDKLNNIINEFPELNVYWLLYGDGEMLKKIENRQNVGNVSINGNGNNCFNNGSEIQQNTKQDVVPQEPFAYTTDTTVAELVRQQDKLIDEIREQNQQIRALTKIIVEKIK